MKKILIALAAVLITGATYAQGVVGTINFNNRAPTVAPVEINAVGGPGPGPTYSAGLFLKSGTDYTLIQPSVTTFRDPAGGSAALAKYINALVVDVPGSQLGQSVTVQMRAWLTSAGSFDASANARGSSGDLVIAALGGGASPPADLPSSFTGFVVTVVPEPSTIALGALGVAALLLRRRK